MGKLISSGLWHKKENKDDCPTCGMTKKKGCCEDKHKTLKIDKQYDLNLSTVSISKLPLEGTYDNSINFHLKFVPALLVNYPLSNSPPGINKILLYATNCVYRI
jgi:hypothetical protein